MKEFKKNIFKKATGKVAISYVPYRLNINMQEGNDIGRRLIFQNSTGLQLGTYIPNVDGYITINANDVDRLYVYAEHLTTTGYNAVTLFNDANLIDELTWFGTEPSNTVNLGTLGTLLYDTLIIKVNI